MQMHFFLLIPNACSVAARRVVLYACGEFMLTTRELVLLQSHLPGSDQLLSFYWKRPSLKLSGVLGWVIGRWAISLFSSRQFSISLECSAVHGDTFICCMNSQFSYVGSIATAVLTHRGRHFFGAEEFNPRPILECMRGREKEPREKSRCSIGEK